jgi:hypothetical protein
LADLYKRKLLSFDIGEERAVDAKEFRRLAALADELNAAPLRNNTQIKTTQISQPSAPASGFGRR